MEVGDNSEGMKTQSILCCFLLLQVSDPCLTMQETTMDMPSKKIII